MANCNHRYARLNDHQVFCKRCGDIKGYYTSSPYYWHWKPWYPYWPQPYWFSNTNPNFTVTSTAGDWAGSSSSTVLNSGTSGTTDV